MKNGQKKALGVWKKATVLGAAFLVALAGSAMAGQAAGAASQGVQAHVDPATGQLRQPDAAEAKALADALRARFASVRSVRAAQVTQHPDGSISATLGPESLNVWVVTVGADGSLNPVCIEGAGAAPQGGQALEVK